MLLVKTKMASSTIDGIGLFADEFIASGTLVWRLQPGFDLEIAPHELRALPKLARETFLKYAYLRRSSNTYILGFDDARFFNHSDTPNTRSIDTPDGSVNADIAAREINKGEELTTDYRLFDSDAELKLANTNLPALEMTGRTDASSTTQ
jgi:SET domain-containing protein